MEKKYFSKKIVNGKKAVHTYDIFFASMNRVSRGTFRIFREIVKLSIDRLPYSERKILYSQMKEYVDKRSDRWEGIFFEMLVTRFPLQRPKPIRTGTIICECGNTWRTGLKLDNRHKIKCPVCGSRNLFIKI